MEILNTFTISQDLLISLSVWAGIGILVAIVIYMVDPRNEKGNPVTPVLLGIIGALLGGAIGQYFINPGYQFMDWAALVGAAIGALVLTLIHRFSAGQSDHFKTSVHKV